jgi:hypothetical protein
MVTATHKAFHPAPIPAPVTPPVADSAPREPAWMVMFEFPEHPIPLAEEASAVTVFEPIRISKTVLPEGVNGEKAVMFTSRSSMVTSEFEMSI